jgi:hypothetical protein
MLPKPSRAPRLAFGPFEFDAAAVELFKHGYKVKLPLQPGQVLAALLDRPGAKMILLAVTDFCLFI